MPQVLLDFEPDAEGKLMQGAEYDWGNAQYGAKFGDENMELTFINWDKETNAPATVTEKGPFQFGGTYIGDYTDETYYPACYVLGSAGYSLFTWHASYMKEHSATVQVVNGDEGETRFGDYSMRLDYDYTDLLPGYRNVNEYLYYADTSDAAKTDLYSGISLDGTRPASVSGSTRPKAHRTTGYGRRSPITMRPAAPISAPICTLPRRRAAPCSIPASTGRAGCTVRQTSVRLPNMSRRIIR